MFRSRPGSCRQAAALHTHLVTRSVCYGSIPVSGSNLRLPRVLCGYAYGMFTLFRLISSVILQVATRRATYLHYSQVFTPMVTTCCAMCRRGLLLLFIPAVHFHGSHYPHRTTSYIIISSIRCLSTSKIVQYHVRIYCTGYRHSFKYAFVRFITCLFCGQWNRSEPQPSQQSTASPRRRCTHGILFNRTRYIDNSGDQRLGDQCRPSASMIKTGLFLSTVGHRITIRTEKAHDALGRSHPHYCHTRLNIYIYEWVDELELHPLTVTSHL